MKTKKKEIEKKERGVWLTIWLTFMLITNFFVALTYFLFNNTIAAAYPTMPIWVWYIYGILALSNFIWVIFLFKWRKWPFFAFCGNTLIALIMNLYIGVDLFTSFFGLIGPIILYLSMRSRWDLFE